MDRLIETDADGAAFVSAANALENMRKTQRIGVGDAPVALAAALPLVEAVSARWTARQAEVVLHALALPAPSQAAVADALDLSQQALQKHWSAAAAPHVLAACHALESSKHLK